MPKVSEIETPFARGLLYGVSGSWKTATAGTMPGRKYWFNYDQDNIISLKARGIEAEYDNYDNRDGYIQFLSKLMQLKKLAEKKEFPYDVGIVDTGQGLYRSFLQHITRLGNREEKPQIQDWGLAQDRMRDALKELMRLPWHFFCIFHEQMEKDEISGRVIGRILLAGRNFPEEVPAMFNMFLRFVVTAQKDKEETVKVSTTPTTIWPASQKFGNALLPIEEPDLALIWDKVTKHMAGIKDGSIDPTKPQPEPKKVGG